VLIKLPQQKAAPPCYPIPGSSHHIPGGSVENQPLLFFVFQVPALSEQVAGGEREENWEGGALLPLESLIFVLLFCLESLLLCAQMARETEREQGDTDKEQGHERNQQGEGTGEEE